MGRLYLPIFCALPKDTAMRFPRDARGQGALPKWVALSIKLASKPVCLLSDGRRRRSILAALLPGIDSRISKGFRSLCGWESDRFAIGN